MFRTELTITPQARPLARTARVLTVGSCFAESLGERLRQHKVAALVNPFGTVFQPLALAQLLRAAAGETQDWQQHLVEARGRWQSYDFHGSLGAETPVELLRLIQTTVQQVADFVRTADAVVLTLGTAWAYRLRETGELVSNLHKLPAALFEKELLTADEVVNALAEVHALLRRLNPEVHIVLTVSPVRHLKDTLPLNAVSKSVCRVACHYLSELLPDVSYFPAYELLTDDLRDYRFYAADMLHPSDVAQDYIWERFTRAYFDADFGRFRHEWAAVRQALGHRPLHPGAPEHRTFLDQTAERLQRLAGQGVDVRTELRDVQRQLAALPPPRAPRPAEPAGAEEDDEERIDIGEGTAKLTPGPGAATAATPGRDEQRTGRRGGRNQRNRPPRAGAAAPPLGAETAAPGAVVEAGEPVEPVIVFAPVPVAAAPIAAAESSLIDANGYPAKKKKRRSRGGAKRTARKHAAQLATEQLSGEDVVGGVKSPLPGVEVPPSALETAEPSSELFDSETIIEIPAAAESAVIIPAPTSGRKRGTGPTPKKSKVITKTSPVKRGGLNNRAPAALYRPKPTDVNPATAPMGTPAAAQPAGSTAPAVERGPSTVEPPRETTGAPAASAAITLTSTPAKSRRGRPKASQPAGTDTAATPAPVPAPPAPPEPVTATPPPTTAQPRRATKKAAPKAAAAAPAASSSDTPAATRRGRPPGKPAAAPAVENPAT